MVSDKEPTIFGYQLKIVQSGSMEPGIKTGSVIIVEQIHEQENFAENDVITFREENNRLVTHRIIEVIQQDQTAVYRTKGDHNDGPDKNLVLQENIVAAYTGITVPFLGYVIAFIQSSNGALLIILSGMLLLLYSFFTIWSAFTNLTTVQSKENKQTADENNVLIKS